MLGLPISIDWQQSLKKEIRAAAIFWSETIAPLVPPHPTPLMPLPLMDSIEEESIAIPLPPGFIFLRFVFLLLPFVLLSGCVEESDDGKLRMNTDSGLQTNVGSHATSLSVWSVTLGNLPQSASN